MNEQQRRMARGIECAADGGNVGDDACGGLVMGGENGLDPVRCVGGQDRLVTIRRQARPPRCLDDFDIETMALAQINPAMAEHAVTRGQHLVARRQRVGDRHLPTTRPGGGKQEHLGRGSLENGPNPCHRRCQHLGKGAGPVVKRRNIHRPAQVLGHIGRSGDEDGVLHGCSSSISHWGQRSSRSDPWIFF